MTAAWDGAMRALKFSQGHRVAMACAEILQKEFPHYAWGATPTPDGSMIDIVIGDLPGGWGIKIDMRIAQQESGRRKKLRAFGGELLERYQRARHQETAISDIMLNKNTRGHIVPEGFH